MNGCLKRLHQITKKLTAFFLLLCPLAVIAQSKIVNVYAWTGEIPGIVIQQFEKETGIKVNFSTYENNDIMYAKLRASQGAEYDVIMPSSYFIDHMRRQNMLLQLDKKKLSQWKNIHPAFLHPPYDPGKPFSVPFIWGTTGIFINTDYYSEHDIHTWSDLWDKRFKDRLMLLDDTSEIFPMSLISLGYSANDRDPQHLEAAFLKLKALMPNVKVFSTDAVVSIIIDEDATIGMAWNGDAYKAMQENPKIKFIFPQDGFLIWVDNFAIPIHAPHQDTAYTFINFILRPDIAKKIAIMTNFPTANLAAQKLLPPSVRNNTTAYPPPQVLRRGQFQTDIGDATLALYEKYWEKLKMNS